MNRQGQKKNRGIALLLVVTLLAGIFLILRNAVLANDEIVLSEGDTLNGWELDAYWANGTKVQTIHSASNDQHINVKLTIEYYAPITAMTRDYAPGTVSFRVPDIGSVKRSGAPFVPVTAADSVDSIWNCTYDMETESYVFTNKATIERNKPLSGGFELMWTLESRKCLDDYHLVRSPVFMLENEGTRMTPLEFHTEMERDYYHLNMLRSYISYQEYVDEGFQGKSFVTYNYRTDFGLQMRARADDRSSYFVRLHFEDENGDPAVVSDELMGQIVINADNEEHLLSQITDPYTGETVWGFYRFENREGSMLSSDNFRLSYPIAIEEMDVFAVLDSYLSVHYLDDPQEQVVTYTTQTAEENLHQTSAGMVSNYSFTYGKGNFSMYKTSDYEIYSSGQSRLNEGSAPAYSQKLLAKKVFNVEKVTFTVGGNYRATTSSGSGTSVRKTTSTSAGTGEEDVEITQGVDLQTKFDFVLGDDRLSVRRENAGGTMSESMVESSEYTISRIVYPRNTSTDKPDYDYEVWVSAVGYTAASDRVARPEEYVLFGTGNTRSEKVFDFRSIKDDARFSGFEEGVKAVYVVIRNIPSYKSYGTYYLVDISFHFDPQTSGIDTGADSSPQTGNQETGDTNEAHITNIGFMRAFRAGETTNLCATRTDSFDGSFSSRIIRQDAKSYNDNYTEEGSPDRYELLYHCKSNVYLRDVTTFLSSGTKVTSTPRQKEDGGGHVISIKSLGSIYAERPDDSSTGELGLFSLYVKLPSLLTIDSSLDGVGLSDCTGKDLYGNVIPNSEFENHVSYRLFTISTGERVIAADFDFTDNPLDIFSVTKLSLNIPALVSYMDLKVADSKQFEVTSYTMLRDAGVGRINAVNGPTYDTYGFNGTERLEIMASSRDSKSYAMIVEEWEDTTQKLVKAFSDDTWQYEYDTTLHDWISSTTVHASSPVLDAAANQRSTYSYRISADLGATSSDLLFYDRLESEEESEWNGNLQSIDFTYARHLGLTPSVYYSTELKDYEETLTGDLLATYTNNIQEFTSAASGEWSADGTLWTAPVDNIRTIVVKLNTAGLDGGVIHGKQVYFVVNMNAPDDHNGDLLGKFAVNSHRTYYTVHSSYSNSRRNMKSMKSYVEMYPAVVLVTLRKSDQKTGNMLTGAEFSFYTDRNRTPVRNWKNEIIARNLPVNSLGELVVDCLPPGVYYFEETKAPFGYRLDDTLYELNISGTAQAPVGDQDYHNNALLDFRDQRLYGKIILTKKDADDPAVEGIAGAEYMLYDAGGSVVFTDQQNEYAESDGTKSVFTTNEEGKLVISGLPWGTYYLVEQTPPVGYHLNRERIRVTIGRSLNPDEQITENAIVARVEQTDEEKTASLRLIKYDRDGTTPLSNAWFALEKKNADGSFSTVGGFGFIKTGRDGSVMAEELKFGTYRFKEVNAPVGYVLDEATRYSSELVLSAATVGTVQTAQMTNERIAGSATLKKTSDDGLPLNGALFDLYLVNGDIDPQTNDENDPEDVPIRLGLRTGINAETGEAGWLPTVTGLDWGRYYFKEFSSPGGYEKDETIYPFEITAANAAIVYDTLRYTNQRKKGAVVLTKTAGEAVGSYDAGDPLENAEFVLCTSEGEELYVIPDPDHSGEQGYYSLAAADAEGALRVMKTDASGQLHVDDLDWNAYYLEETRAPSGFALCEKVRFTVNAKSCLSEQELESEDMAMKCLIRIDKVIDRKLAVFGTPTFLFRITNTDNGKTFLRSVSLKGDALTGSVTAQVQAGSYRVEEIPVLRYKLTGTRYILPDSTALDRRIDGILTDEKENGSSFTFTLGSTDNIPHEAHIEFTNTLEDYSGLSHADAALNIVPSRRKLTGFGLNLRDEFIPCLRTEHADPLYEVSLEDLEGVLIYDDGSEEPMTSQQLAAVVKTGDWSIDNGFIHSGQSFPLQAQYTAEGKTYKTTFFVTVEAYKVVESQKVIFRNDMDNSSTFIIGNRQSAVNVVYYNDNTAGTEKIAVSGEYIAPTVLSDMGMVMEWRIVGGEHDGEVLLPNEAAVKKYLKDEYDNGLRLLELRAVVTHNVFDYNQLDEIQEFVAPKDGIYLLEGWGAQGGGAKQSKDGSYPVMVNNSNALNERVEDVEGGKGGYSYGYVYLMQGQKVYIAVGGKGRMAQRIAEPVFEEEIVFTNKVGLEGGFNGGGHAVLEPGLADSAVGSGGGATHFAFGTNRGVLSGYSENTNEVLLVAGGGGGSGYFQNLSQNQYYHHGIGGCGGGEESEGNSQNGGSALRDVNGSNQTSASTNIWSGDKARSNFQNASFGQGGSSSITATGYRGSGGGGGWYGGAAAGVQGSAGGSGHVGEGLITGATIGGNQSFRAPDGSIETGHSGDGHARITYISNGEFNLGYSGKTQSFTAPTTSYYKLEAWGAAGGTSKVGIQERFPLNATNDNLDEVFKDNEGGRGGYSSGYVYLTAGQTIYYTVGGMGDTLKYEVRGAPLAGAISGGFNGGGGASLADGSGYTYNGCGGGATHFALTITGNGLLADYSSNKSDVLMVAGGGGGSGYYDNPDADWHGKHIGTGGAGGGLEGGGNYDNYSNNSGYKYATGGTQTAGGSGNTPGSFGTGATCSSWSTGGGGGWYGGGATSMQGGAGGSSYIGSSLLISGQTIAGNTVSYTTSDGRVMAPESMPTHEGAIVDNGIVGFTSHDTEMIGNRGDGFARITLMPYKEPIDYTYTEMVQSFTAPVTGFYQLEAWGASGGDAEQTDKPEYGFQRGGRGGYSYGTVYLKAGETIYVAVGGEGASERVTVKNNILPGGFNGGGATHAGTVDTYKMVAAGGGATHFAYALDSGSGGVLSDYSAETDQSKVLLVAGGGGGALYCRYNTTNGWFVAYGGYGGGEIGGNGEIIASGRVEFIGSIPGGEQQQQTENPTKFKYGTFGKGADADSKTGDSGGGGGWYGGAKYQYQNGVLGGMCGGGGSGHCNSDVLLEEYGYDTVGGNQTFYAPDGSEESGHTGHGHARVTFLGAPDSQEFDYTGTVQSFTASQTGTYLLEAWGAGGGDGQNLTDPSFVRFGGKGGYTSGSIRLTEGQTVYVYVGGAGKYNNLSLYDKIGGFNGGGDASDGAKQSGSGGGATDFRMVSSTASNGWGGFDSLKSRIMVAAGGGGCAVANSKTPRYCGNGGSGGGLSGQDMTENADVTSTQYGLSATQNAPGISFDNVISTEGGFGFGGNGKTSSQSAGGGGGYYGGGGASYCAPAGGGSSFISGYPGCNAIAANSTESDIIHTNQPNHYSGLVFTQAVMIAGNEEMPTHDGASTMTGNTGNGFAKITYLG